MENQTISVLISTVGRQKPLTRCLESLCRQTVKPYETVVVDNNPSEQTKLLCARFSDMLRITYVTEKRRGLPFGRNKSIALCRGKIAAFIDDDCAADDDWLFSILRHFRRYTSAGVIGYTRPMNLQSIPGRVEDVYYRRWMMQNIPALQNACRLRSGAVIDFRNAAFSSAFIKRFRFDTRLLVSCEDVELGVRMFHHTSDLYFDPAIRAAHENSRNFETMWSRNFRTGWATQELLDMELVKSTDLNRPYNKRAWFAFMVHSSGGTFLKRTGYFALLAIFPLASRFGRITEKFAHLFRRSGP